MTEYARVLGPGDRELRALDGCTPQVVETLSDFKALMSRHGELGAELCTLADKVTVMRNIDYSDFVGMLNLTRFTENNGRLDQEVTVRLENRNLTSSYRDVLDSVNRLYQLRYADQNRNALARAGDLSADYSVEREVAENVMLLARMAYPYGINLWNADWKLPGDGGRPAAETAMLYHCGLRGGIDEESGCFLITPDYRSNAATKVVFVPRGEDPQAMGLPSARVTNGESIILGRAFRYREMFNISSELAPGQGKERVELRVDVKTHSSSHWSRGAIMVVRQDDRIFIFDRGSRYDLVVDTAARQVTYLARTIVAEAAGRRYTHGHTEIFLKPGEGEVSA